MFNKKNLLFLILVPFSSFAGRYCIISGIDESGYRENCRYGESQKVTGDAFATYADPFNVNPSSLPTMNTPFALEGIVSRKNAEVAGSDTNFSVVKGLTGFGLGVASNPDNTFYSTSLVQKTSIATQGPYSVQKDSMVPTLNLGLATDFFNRFIKSKYRLPSIGYAYRHNQSKGTNGYALGTSLNQDRFSFGFSYVHEPQTALVPEENFKTYSVGVDLNLVVLDFSYIQNKVKFSAGAYEAKFNAIITSASLFLSSFLFSVSYKKYQNYSQSIEELWMSSIQYVFLKNFRLMYLYNYVPGSHSIGLQALL